MSENVMIAIISALPSILVAIVTVVTNNKLISYKIEQLELRVEKHNQVVEKVAVLQRDVKTAFNRIDETRSDVEKLEDRLAVQVQNG